jgi:hypothetical protein
VEINDPLGTVFMKGMLPDLSESHRSRIKIMLTILDEALYKFVEWSQGKLNNIMEGSFE